VSRPIRLTALVAAVIACAIAPAAAHAHHSVLAGQWHLDEGATNNSDVDGATPDSSGHGLTGTVESMAPATGRFGTAFTGINVNSIVRFAPAPELRPANVTLIAWARRAGDPGAVKVIAGHGADGTCGHASYALYTGGSAPGAAGLQFYIWNGLEVRISPNAGTSMWDGQWHMIAGTYDGSAVRLYLDGREVGSGTPASGNIAYGLATDTLSIGNYANPPECGGITNFTGDVDETRVYNRALTASEIARMAAGTGTVPPVLVPDAPQPAPPGPPAPAPPAPEPVPAEPAPAPPAPPAAPQPAPAAPPVARLVGPARVRPLQPLVLDASASVNATSLRWDIGGDGRDDVECAPDAPFLSVRTATAQTLDVRLTVVGADGSTAITRQTVAVAGLTIAPSAAKRVQDVAVCSSSPRILGGLNVAALACVQGTTVFFGVIEARGCFTNVKERKDVPAAEARVVDEYYAKAKLPAFAEALCKQGSPRCPELLSRYTALDLLVSTRPVRINGIDFRPRDGASIVVFPGLERVVSSNAVVTMRNATLGTIPIRSGAIDLDVKGVYNGFGKGASRTGRVSLLSFDAKRDLPSIGGFRLDGQIDLTLFRRDGQYFTEARVRIALPPIFQAFGGRPPTGESTMRADNRSGLVLDRLRLAVPEANLGGLRFTNVTFDYSHSGDAANNCPRRWWKATANVFLGSTGRDAGFVLSPPPSQNGIAFCSGAFRSAGGSMVFGAQIPPPQLFPGVQLDRVDFAVALDPTLVRGGGALSVAGLTDITGVFLTVFPSPAAPYVLTAEDAGRELAAIAGRRLISTSVALGGSAGVRVPALGRIPLGNAYVLYSFPDYVAFGGSAQVIVPGFRITGTIAGELAARSRLFSLYGGVRACIGGIGPCLGMGAWVTSKGFVACLTGDGLHPGAGYRWGDKWPTIWLFDGCKPSRYWVDVRGGAAAAQAGTRTITLARGERGKNVRLVGRNGAPSVSVRGPDGETVSTDGREYATGRTIQVLRQQDGNVTWVGVAGRRGTYTITELPGSPAIAGLAATRPGDGTITASVTRSGDRRVLRYDAGRADGTRITFFEKGRSTFRRLGAATSGRGTIRFTPAPGPAGVRTIVADIEVDGVQAPQRVVARFRATGPSRAGRVRELRVRRAGGALVATWRSAAAPRRYGVVVRQRNGRTRLVTVPGQRRRLRIPGIPRTQRGTVTVRALGPLGDWGAPSSATFRATRREATRLRPFSELGRRRGR
jgi:hypothetical protein